VSSASPGAVVCLDPGSWSAIKLTSIAPAFPGVTLAATPGQAVVVPGFTVTGSNTQNLTIEGFDVTVPATTQTDGGNTSNGFELLCGIAGGVTLEYNTIENQPRGNGIYVYPGNCGSGHTQSGVTIEYNQIDHVATALEMDGNISTQLNWVVSHNVIGPYIQDGEYGHYIQIQGISGLTMDNNAFEGPPDASYEDCAANGSASHLNVLHIDTGGQRNVTFDNNIVWHSQTCGDTVLIQDSPTDNIQIENNLDVEDPTCATMTPYPCDANPVLVQAPHGLTFNHNTLVNVERGSSFGGTCATCYSDPQNMTAEYNIGTPSISGDEDFNLWKCSSSCTTQANVSADTSANTVLGGIGNLVKWTPSWRTTSWTPVIGPGYQPPPSGYYQPTALAILGAGYQGQVGP
jgi:hypothetical protein